MNLLTVNQNIDLIEEHIRLNPENTDADLYKKLNYLRKLKRKGGNPKGGLMPYANTMAIQNKIAILNGKAQFKHLSSAAVINIVITK